MFVNGWYNSPTIKSIGAIALVAGTVTAVTQAWPYVGWLTVNNILAWRSTHEAGIHEQAASRVEVQKLENQILCLSVQGELDTLKRAQLRFSPEVSREIRDHYAEQVRQYEVRYRKWDCSKVL